MKQDFQIISKAFKNQFVIPKFGDFCGHITSIYEDCVSIRAGSVASYIPQLASYSPESWGVSIVTVDGQRYNKGDTYRYCVQTKSMFPFKYKSLDLGSQIIGCSDSESLVFHEDMLIC